MSAELIVTLVGVIASCGIAWGTALTKLRGLKERLDEFESHANREIERLREFKHQYPLSMAQWQHQHEKEAGEYRIDFTQQIGSLAIAVAKNDERFLAIMGMLEKIDERMNRLKVG
jgi:ribosome-associated translation inhibitor RaiA